MLGAGEYLAGVAEVALVAAALGVAAAQIRGRILPGWTGAPARLVEVVIGIALLVWISELLGSFEVLREETLVAACLAAGAAVVLGLRLAGRDAEPAEEESEPAAAEAPPAPPVEPLALLVTVGVCALLFAHWGFETKQSLDHGITNFDSLWYQMPFAVDIAQSGSTTGLHFTEPLFLNWFYPQNSELLHADAILLTGRDTLSLFINLGWLAVALLSAWCIGRPFGRAPLTVAAAAVLLECHTLVVREPGAAKNDIVGVALVLAAIAILLNSNEARRDQGLVPGWAVGVAGLAAGLAAGTKYTVLAAIAALTVAVIYAAQSGRRRAIAIWWLAPALAAGGYWYARNLVLSGNPIPQIRELGPLSLPGPERLQEARPDFSIAHYATDTGVWSEYFWPGLDQAFGSLWPLVIAIGVAGALIALVRGPGRLLRGLGAVALFAMAAYLFMPLSAAGEEGMPVGFAINVRFVIPALIVGLVLVALAPGLERAPPLPRRVSAALERIPGVERIDGRWALLAALCVLLVLTNRSDAVARVPERGFGIFIAIIAVLVPAVLALAKARGAPRAAVGAGFAGLALVAVLLGYSIQRDYLRGRFYAFDPAQHLDSAYRWAADVSAARIGLAGTTAGFTQYGFFGTDLSNEVRYIGDEGANGAFAAIPSCREFREAVNAGEFDFVVTSPFLNFAHTSEPLRSPEASWLGTDPGVVAIDSDGPVTVWKVRGRLHPGDCEEVDAPTRFLPGPGGKSIPLDRDRGAD